MNDSAIRILIALILAVLCISASLAGRPGSILGALIDANNMAEG